MHIKIMLMAFEKWRELEEYELWCIKNLIISFMIKFSLIKILAS